MDITLSNKNSIRVLAAKGWQRIQPFIDLENENYNLNAEINNYRLYYEIRSDGIIHKLFIGDSKQSVYDSMDAYWCDKTIIFSQKRQKDDGEKNNS